jgi:hypothetical protein
LRRADLGQEQHRSGADMELSQPGLGFVHDLCKRQFSQPSLDPVCLDVREVLAVDPRRAPCLRRGNLLLERHWA